MDATKWLLCLSFFDVADVEGPLVTNTNVQYVLRKPPPAANFYSSSSPSASRSSEGDLERRAAGLLPW